MKKLISLALGCVAIGAAAIALGALQSGLKVGDTVTPFHPTHLSGPDKGTDTCPPCKYGNRPAVQAWFHMDSEANMTAIARELNSAVASSKKDFKAFMIMMKGCEKCEPMAKSFATKAEKSGLKNVAIATLDGKDEAVKNYKINTDSAVKNTILVYKDRKVVARFVNLKADAAGMRQLRAAIASVQN